MSIKSDLLAEVRKMDDAVAGIMFKMAKELRRYSNTSDGDNSDLPAPRRPGRPRKNDDAVPEKRGRGRPRKNQENDDGETTAKRGRGRPRKEDTESNPRSNARSAPAAAKPRAAATNTDYSDMNKSELRAAAEKLGLNVKAAKISDNNLAKALASIHKMAGGSKSVEAIEKLATRASVDLSFGRGRPPSDDYGLKRRIIVKMMNEGESPL
jgi:hypothetical protein